METEPRVERLIVRHLDGEASAAEAAELAALLARSDAARALLDEYRAMDRVARETLQEAVCKPAAAVVATPRERRGFRLATAAGVMAAAAAIGLFIFPYRPDGAAPGRQRPVESLARASRPGPDDAMVRVRDGESQSGQALPRYPREAEMNVLREWLGAYDPGTDTIYVIASEQREVQTEPVLFER